MAHKLTSAKAKIMLKEGTVRGHKITPKQRRLFGFIAGGGTPSRLHNPQAPYGDNASKVGATPRYSASGKLGKLSG